MINIIRPTQSPASLETKTIKDYLDTLEKWALNPIGDKPKLSVSYRESDLIIRR